MKLVFRYILYALAVLVAFTGAAIRRYPDYRFIDYVPDVLLAGTVTVLVITAVSFWKEDDLTDAGKGWLMRGFLVAILLPTVFTTGAYVHQSSTSWSGGEIHWHADFEVFVDGERLDLISPGNYCQRMARENSYMCSLNDRVGITEYHEHNDMRIHLEGTFKHREEATLAAFFETFRGTLTDSELRFPTDEGWVNVTEEDGKTLKVLVKRSVGGDRGWCAISDQIDDPCISHDTSAQAESPEDYVISPYQRGANLDDIYVIYDETPVAEALEDVQEDDEYKGMGILKKGEGYEG